ncbi:MAG: reverse transcriptase family protein [Candidatus Thiodiazotropha taylori]
MATIGKIGEFREERETFVCYLERFEQFLAANNVADERRVPIFLSVVGPTAYGILKNLLQPTLPKDKDYAAITKALKDHYHPKPIVISERFKFHKRNQREGEKVTDYVVALKKLSIDCEFGTFLNDALRDRLVCGLRAENIQRKLLAEAELTFDRAVNMASAMEMADSDSASFQPQSGASVNVLKVKRPTKPNTKMNAKEKSAGKTPKQEVKIHAKECYRCGEKHNPATCKFKNTKCFNCEKIGHLARKKKKKQSVKYVNETESAENSDSEPEYLMGIYKTSGEDKRKYQVDIQIGSKSVSMEIDTGSEVSIVSKNLYENKLADYPLKQTDLKLKSYSGQKIEIVGQCQVPVKYGTAEQKILPLIIVKGNGPSLLGRNWLQELQLNWTEIFLLKTDTLSSLKSEFKDVFQKNSMPIQGFKAHITMKENAKPVFHKARSVPYALKETVEKELKKQKAEGIMYPVKTSQWATPLVVVPKPDSSVRLCGDYKVTVNQTISEEQYPIPNIDDMFATLAGGKKFTKLDLSQAYLQLELDQESEEYLTVNTSLGLFRYKRLVYGVSSAPAIFQSVMDQILVGLPHVVCRIDDILITAPDDESHLKTLREVLTRLKKHNVKLREDKCIFMADEVVYMGHLVNSQGSRATKK